MIVKKSEQKKIIQVEKEKEAPKEPPKIPPRVLHTENEKAEIAMLNKLMRL